MEQITPKGRPRRGSRPLSELGFLLTALLVIAFDQVSKLLIRANMTPGQSIPEEGLFRITYVTNTGGAFGILGNQAFLMLVTSFVGVAAVLLYSRYPAFNRVAVKIALGLLLGGAIGNLIDRLTLGRVVDFIDLGFWPVFNLADSAIVVGSFILVFFLLFQARRQERTFGSKEE